MATKISVGSAVIEPLVRDITYVEPAVKGHSRARIEDIAYGEPVYWLTLISSVIVIIGSAIAFVTKFNFASPSYWITSVWQGQSTEQIWGGIVNSVPQGHWYLSYLTTGDGLQALGLSIAFFSISVGLVAAAIVLFRRKDKVFGVFALITLAVITASIFS